MNQLVRLTITHYLRGTSWYGLVFGQLVSLIESFVLVVIFAYGSAIPDYAAMTKSVESVLTLRFFTMSTNSSNFSNLSFPKLMLRHALRSRWIYSVGEP